MHPGEPARKKVKLATDLEVLQDTAKSLAKPIDLILRDPSVASDACGLAESTTSPLAITESQSLSVFVLDMQSRLFVTGQLLLKVTLLCVSCHLPVTFVCMHHLPNYYTMTHSKADPRAIATQRSHSESALSMCTTSSSLLSSRCTM